MPAYLLTGASSGIGLATATALARRGADLVLVSRSPADLEQVRTSCEAIGSQCLVVPADIRDSQQVGAAIAAGVERFGRLDAIIHSAGVATYGHFEQVPEEVFDATVATTFLGAANVARAALRQFRAQGGGHLVVVGSLLGDIAVPYMSAYVASKWAVHGLIRSLQLETRSDPDLTITLVSPAGVDTPIYDNAASFLGVQGRPPSPVQSPEQVARRVLAALDRPRRQVHSGSLNAVAKVGFVTAPALFDLLAPAYMRSRGLRRDHQPHWSGNVFAPVAGSGPRTRGRAMKRPVVIQRDVEAPVQAVWQVLSDGWTYATWVVGASRVRDVDPQWPATNSRIHHSFGPWPAVIQDYTRVELSVPEQELVLKARGWPAGEARVVIRMQPTGEGTCRVSIQEDAIAGPGKLIPKGARQTVIGPRNKETLYRLALIAEGRHRNGELD